MKFNQVYTRIPRTTHEYESISKYKSQNPVQCTQYVQNAKMYNMIQYVQKHEKCENEKNEILENFKRSANTTCKLSLSELTESADLRCVSLKQRTLDAVDGRKSQHWKLNC